MIKTMYSTDCGLFNHDSAEEALEDVWNDEEQDAHEYTIYVGDVHFEKASSYVTNHLIGTILESLDVNALGSFGGDTESWPDSTPEQNADLASRLKILIDVWADKHNLQPTFGEAKNIKEIKFKEIEVRNYFYYDYFVEIEK